MNQSAPFLRRCPKCKQEKPLTDFYTGITHRRCKQCTYEDVVDYRLRNRKHYKELQQLNDTIEHLTKAMDLVLDKKERLLQAI